MKWLRSSLVASFAGSCLWFCGWFCYVMFLFQHEDKSSSYTRDEPVKIHQSSAYCRWINPNPHLWNLVVSEWRDTHIHSLCLWLWSPRSRSWTRSSTPCACRSPGWSRSWTRCCPGTSRRRRSGSSSRRTCRWRWWSPTTSGRRRRRACSGCRRRTWVCGRRCWTSSWSWTDCARSCRPSAPPRPSRTPASPAAGPPPSSATLSSRGRWVDEEEEALGDFSSGVLGWGFAAAFFIFWLLLCFFCFLWVFWLCVCVCVCVCCFCCCCFGGSVWVLLSKPFSPRV